MVKTRAGVSRLALLGAWAPSLEAISTMRGLVLALCAMAAASLSASDRVQMEPEISTFAHKNWLQGARVTSVSFRFPFPSPDRRSSPFLPRPQNFPYLPYRPPGPTTPILRPSGARHDPCRRGVMTH